LAHGALITTANAGDHPSVLRFLMQAHQASLADDFQSRLDEPSYRPSNRLIVRRESQLLAHVHVASHIGWFEGQRVPLVKLEDFTVLPEYRDSDFDLELLAAAESIAAAEGAVLAVVHTGRPEWFDQRGWSLLRGQGHTRADARAVLAHLDAQAIARRRRRRSLQVRTWRHFELDEVRNVYDLVAAGQWGPLYRSEACWQWLVGRKAQDQVLLAIDRPKRAATNGSAGAPAESVVGYAVASGSCIVEMMTLGNQTSARVALLARACQDAIDRGYHSIALYTPADDPLHELMVTAGGAWISDRLSTQPRWMMRLLAPERWVERAYLLWRRRARIGGVRRPFEIGFLVDGAAYQFALTRRSSRLENHPEAPAPYAACTRQTFESLLTGNLAAASAVASGQLRLSHAELAAPLAAVFAPRLFWQSPLELMRL
jgi:predicted acetyltransferase